MRDEWAHLSLTLLDGIGAPLTTEVVIMKLEIAVEVKHADVIEKAVRGRTDGREYLIREQLGYVDTGKPYPQEVRIPVETGREPYAVGKYLVDPTCLYVDRYGKLSLGRVKLVPAK
jgi:hypothetical protein